MIFFHFDILPTNSYIVSMTKYSIVGIKLESRRNNHKEKETKKQGRYRADKRRGNNIYQIRGSC